MEQPMAQGTGKTRDSSGASPGTVRGSAICAVLGGLFLLAYAIIMAMKPRGCGGPECVAGSYRDAGPIDSILFLAGIGLIIATAVGLFRMHRFGGSGSKVVRVAALVAAISLLIGVGMTPVFFYVALAALILAVLAFAVTGAGLMRSPVLPAWSGVLLIVASLLLFGANTENEQILLVIPFGLTWMVLGGLLWFSGALEISMHQVSVIGPNKRNSEGRSSGQPTPFLPWRLKTIEGRRIMKQPAAQGRGNAPDASGAANPGTFRGIAICAGLGGLSLVAYAILMNLKPRGCIAEECVGQSYRAAGPLESTLGLAALGLMIITAVGLYGMHRFEGRGAQVVRIAALTAVASLLVGTLGAAIMSVSFQSDSSWVLVVSALLLAMLAFAVVGAGLMRSRVLPPWAGAMLILTSLLLLVHNDQNERVLLVIPFGMTWMVLGGLLWSTTASPSSRWHARIQHV